MVLPNETTNPKMNVLIHKSLEMKVGEMVTTALLEKEDFLNDFEGDILHAHYNAIIEDAVYQACPYAQNIWVDLSRGVNFGKGDVHFTVGGVELSSTFTKPEKFLAKESAALQMDEDLENEFM